jgi:hypothetical protein
MVSSVFLFLCCFRRKPFLPPYGVSPYWHAPRHLEPSWPEVQLEL